tara:strand:- start:326 stop:502 length:177 start_codon:yes stop_codon:yes gene_type:complete
MGEGGAGAEAHAEYTPKIAKGGHRGGQSKMPKGREQCRFFMATWGFKTGFHENLEGGV